MNLSRACLALAICTACSGASLVVTPSVSSLNVGGAFTVDVSVTGLTTGAAPSLGAFQLDFVYDNALLSLDGLTFGSQLSLNGTNSLQGFIPGVGSAVAVFESSFNTSSELNDGQLGDFLLFQLALTAVAPGSSTLTLANLIMADAELVPNDISGSFTFTGSSVTIESDPAVPEPGALALVSLGTALILLRQKLRA